MLQAYPDAGTCEISAERLRLEGLKDRAWIDLQDPTAEEIAEVERACGLRVPPRGELREIEVSSRIRLEREALYMSAPLLRKDETGATAATPTGFVLNARVCLTVRFAASAAFDEVKASLRGAGKVEAADVFARLIEEVVDRSADHLEHCAEELDRGSHAIFHEDAARNGRRHKLTQDTRELRRIMTQIGRASEQMSAARYTLVCIGRMAQFASDRGRPWLPHPVQERLASVRADAASLEQYEENLLSRVQLLQDAATAFISIEQNDVVKVLTIASVVGVPPVMVVGLYGMNFKYMPELGWRYGYPYALALIVVTTVIPLLWFKWKDWM